MIKDIIIHSDSALHHLAALRQRRDMLHDGPEHRRALGDLFYGPYPKMSADWITPAPLSMPGEHRIGTFFR